MTSVLPDDLGQPSNAEIKTEDCSAQTNTAVNRDAVTEHEHAQDLPETSGFRKQTTGEYENIQYKQEPTWHWHTAAENSSAVDTACTCNCNNTADFHDTKDCVAAAAEYGILCTDVCFPGEVKVIKDTCTFTMCVHKSMFSRGVIDRLGVEELKTNIEIFLHTENARDEDTPRHSITGSSQITKDDCDTAESEATGTVQTQHKHNTCMRCGDDFICTSSVKQHALDHTRLQSYLCEKCTAVSQTSDGGIQVNLETIPDNGESTDGNTAAHNSMFKHTPHKTHMCDGSGKRVSNELDAEEDKPISTVQNHFACARYGRSFIRKRDFDKKKTSQTNGNSFQCTACVKTSREKYNLHNHRQTNTGDKAHTYTYCEQTTQNSNVSKHNRSTQKEDYDQEIISNNDTIASRKLIQHTFRSIDILKDEIKDRGKITAHFQNHVDNDTVIPDSLGEVTDADCGTTQAKQTASKGDTNVCTKKNYFLCDYCGKLFDRKSILEKHCLVHIEEKTYKCSECEKTYRYKKGLKIHTRIHTGERPYRCSFCDSTFIQKCNLTYHLRTHTGERPYRCSQCGKTYKNYNHLKVHMHTHTGERPYNCTYCHETFTIKSNLNSHIRSHTGEKPYKCTHCDKTFAMKNILTDHFRTHTGEKPYKCTHCDKTFASKPNFTRHIRNLTEEKPHKCTHCDKTYVTKCILNRHIKTHTGERPHKCTHCDKTFAIKSAFTRHTRTHTGEKPHTCIICRKKFNRKEHLRKHTLVHTKHDHSNDHTMNEGLPQKSNELTQANPSRKWSACT